MKQVGEKGGREHERLELWSILASIRMRGSLRRSILVLQSE